jgi:glycosyltransferase involved in cell wall biosynthesis
MKAQSSQPKALGIRVLIDSVPVGSGGLLQLRDELTDALSKHAPPGSSVVLLTASPSGGLRPSDNLTIVPQNKPKLGWVGRWWWYNRRLPQLAREYQADVVYSLSGILTARATRDVAGVNTVNNMLPFSPADTEPFPLLSRERLRYSLLRRLYVSGLRRADSVVLHSRHALELVTPHTGDISKKTFVVLTGVPRDINQILVSQHPEGGRPYWLYFSAFYPYKNHIRLIEAYQKSLSVEPELPDLVLAGMPVDRTYFERVMRALEDVNLGTKIRYVGTLSRTDIPIWIRNAEINFFASTCETNPVTVAEILGLGAVLACSISGPMPEIVGGAAEYFDPHSVASISDTMLRLFRDPGRRKALRESGRKRAEQLSWDQCGIQMWKAAQAAQRGYEARKSRV